MRRRRRDGGHARAIGEPRQLRLRLATVGARSLSRGLDRCPPEVCRRSGSGDGPRRRSSSADLREREAPARRTISRESSWSRTDPLSHRSVSSKTRTGARPSLWMVASICSTTSSVSDADRSIICGGPACRASSALTFAPIQPPPRRSDRPPTRPTGRCEVRRANACSRSVEESAAASAATRAITAATCANIARGSLTVSFGSMATGTTTGATPSASGPSTLAVRLDLPVPLSPTMASRS